MERIDFLATDRIVLNGILYTSERKTKDIILAVHGMSSNCFKTRDEIIANEANKNNIDYFCFNNRGSELVRYIAKEDGEKSLGGTTYEDPTESYEDIVGAILKIKELGYENIYLQGHSLGCTKVVYTYNELKDEESNDILKNIKGVILLSMVDIPETLKVFLKENENKYLKIAEDYEQSGNVNELMPKESFIHPISVKTFLKYMKYNKEIDIARYSKDDDNLEKLNNIEVPIFMRWGTEKEMILQTPQELLDIINTKLINKNKDIDFINGADHGYHEKEEELAEQIIKFIKEN